LKGLLYGAPGRAHMLGGVSPLRALMMGTVSQTARAATATWRLKEAEGKVLVRST